MPVCTAQWVLATHSASSPQPDGAGCAAVRPTTTGRDITRVRADGRAGHGRGEVSSERSRVSRGGSGWRCRKDDSRGSSCRGLAGYLHQLTSKSLLGVPEVVGGLEARPKRTGLRRARRGASGRSARGKPRAGARSNGTQRGGALRPGLRSDRSSSRAGVGRRYSVQKIANVNLSSVTALANDLRADEVLGRHGTTERSPGREWRGSVRSWSARQTFVSRGGSS